MLPRWSGRSCSNSPAGLASKGWGRAVAWKLHCGIEMGDPAPGYTWKVFQRLGLWTYHLSQCSWLLFIIIIFIIIIIIIIIIHIKHQPSTSKFWAKTTFTISTLPVTVFVWGLYDEACRLLLGVDDVGREDGMKAVGFLMVSEGLIELERLGIIWTDHHHDHHKWDVFRDHIFFGFLDDQSLLCRMGTNDHMSPIPKFLGEFHRDQPNPPLGNSRKCPQCLPWIQGTWDLQ